MTSIYTDRMGLDWDLEDEDDATVASGLDLALTNVTRYLTAVFHFDLDEDEVDDLIDACMDELQESLTEKQIVKAVIALLIPHASIAAHQAGQELDAIRQLPETSVKNGRKTVNNGLTCPDSSVERPEQGPAS